MSDKLKYGFALFLGISIAFYAIFVYSMIKCGISEDLDILSEVYFMIAALGHAALLSLVLFIPIYMPLALLFRKPKTASILYVAVSVVIAMLLILDSLIFDLYKFHFNGFVFELIFGGGATEIFVFDIVQYLKFALIIFAVAAVLFAIRYAAGRTYVKLKSKTITWLSVILLLCVVVSHIGNTIACATERSSIQKSATILPLFFPLSANKLLEHWGIIKVNDLDFRAYNRTTSDIQYPLHPLKLSSGSIPKYNIIYLMIDSWNFTTCDSIISPNIYKFAHEGQMFTDHNSSNYGTRGGIFGLFFGLSFTYENEFQISKMSPLFIDRMLELGYNVETFPSATLISPPFYEIIFRRVPGITVNTKGATPFDRDAAITWNFLNYLDSRDPDKPFFSFVFYDLPHAMTLPEKYQKKFPSTWNAPDYLALNNKTDPEPFFNLYKSCVYRTDQLIGDILAKLKKKRMLENTIIIISGDHGQEFNENKKNYWGHGSNYTKWQIRIPFIIYYPGIEAGKVNSHMTTHYDVAPTLLHRFLGVENPLEDYSMGHDLWDTCSRYPHVVGDHINYAFITPRLILKTGHIGSIDITDHNLNVLPRDSINIKELREAIELKNRFYK